MQQIDSYDNKHHQEMVMKLYSTTMVKGSNDHFHVVKLWPKNQILSKISNIEQSVSVIW